MQGTIDRCRSISPNLLFRQPDDADAVRSHVAILGSVKPLLFRRGMPIRAVALDHQISLGQVEVHDVPVKHPLRFVRLAKIVEYRLHRNLDAACSGIGRRDKDGTAASRAEPEPADQRWPDQSDRSTGFTGHGGLRFIERMVCSSNIAMRFVCAFPGTPAPKFCMPWRHVKRFAAPFTKTSDLWFPIAVQFATIAGMQRIKAARRGAIAIWVRLPFRCERFTAVLTDHVWGRIRVHSLGLPYRSGDATGRGVDAPPAALCCPAIIPNGG